MGWHQGKFTPALFNRTLARLLRKSCLSVEVWMRNWKKKKWTLKASKLFMWTKCRKRTTTRGTVGKYNLNKHVCLRLPADEWGFLFIVCLFFSFTNSWCSTPTGEEGNRLFKRFSSFAKVKCATPIGQSPQSYWDYWAIRCENHLSVHFPSKITLRIQHWIWKI